MRRPENVRMEKFLKDHGIIAVAKYIPDGSLKHTWRLYNHEMRWEPELWGRLNLLGFSSLQGGPLGPFMGNGGLFSVFVRGHYELLQEATNG